MPASIAWNRKPLPRNMFAALPPSAIRPRGWLLDRVAAMDAPALEDRLTRAYLLAEAPLLAAASEEAGRLLACDEGGLTVSDVRALMRYHSGSADKRAALALLAYAKALRRGLLDGAPWEALRAADIGDLLQMALWLYNLTGHQALLELCKLIKAQSPDWMSTFHVFAQTKPVVHAPPPDSDAHCRVHGTSIAASLKVPALQALFEGGLKNETGFRVGWEKLMRYHGAGHGLFNADPLLAGANPSRGLEAETVRALLSTLETLLWAQEDPLAGDLLERVAYGALPAARGRQAANQLRCAPAGNPSGIDRFAASLFMATQDGGLAAMGYAPAEARWRAQGQPVRILVETAYPYREEIQMTVRTKTAVRFPLWLRIPAFAQGASVRVGKEEPAPCEPGFAMVEREWQNGDALTLTLPMRIATAKRYHQTISVERGPLVFSLPVTDTTRWNLALLPGRGFSLHWEGGMPVVDAFGAPVPGWRRSGDAPAPPPVAPDVSEGDALPVRLIPYGMTDARIAQFPIGNSMPAEMEETEG